MRKLILALAMILLSLPAGAQSYVGSKYFPNVAGDLLDSTGAPVALGTCLSLSGNVGAYTLNGTCSSGSSGSSVQARGYYLNTPTGYGPNTTGPYILIPYAVKPGTINGAFAMIHGADGANYSYTVSVIKAGTTNAINVTGLTSVAVSDGENGAANAASYAAPLHTTATGANTYAVGDLVQVQFSTVGGTYISTSFVLSDSE